MSKRVYCCSRIMESNFCPDCGTSFETARAAGLTPFPYQFEIYLHGRAADEGKDEIIKELGLEDGHKLIANIYQCDYEVKLTYEIKDENSSTKLIAVDDMPVGLCPTCEANKRALTQ